MPWGNNAQTVDLRIAVGCGPRPICSQARCADRASTTKMIQEVLPGSRQAGGDWLRHSLVMDLMENDAGLSTVQAGYLKGAVRFG